MAGRNEIPITLNLHGERAATRGMERFGDATEEAARDLTKLGIAAGFADKELGQLDRIGKIGAKSGAAFGAELTSSLMALRGPAIVGAAGLGAALAPQIGATVGAAVLGTVGGAGIIGGIVAASQDARVKDAAEQLGGNLSKAFTKSGESFIAPVIESMSILDTTGQRAAANLEKGFASIAPTLVPLTRGLEGLVDEMMPGLLTAMEAAKPIIRALANELPELGDAFGDMLESISEDTDGAVAALVTLMKIVEGTARAIGGVAGVAEKTFEGITRGAQKLAEVEEKVFGWIPGPGSWIKSAKGDLDATVGAMDKAKDSSGDFAGNLDGLAGSANKARERMLQLSDAMNNFFDVAMNSEKATIAYERSWDEMVETLSKGKRTLDVTTEAGRKNREAIDANIESILREHQARLDEGATMEQSLPIYDQQLERLRKQAISLGYNKDQVNELINVYHLVPEMASTTVDAPGLEQTVKQARELLALLKLISSAGISGAVAGAKVGARASGGPVYAGQTYVVGEHGPEVLQMGNTNGQVYNASQTQAMMSGASGGMATRPLVHITFAPSGNAALDALVQAIWPYLLKQVRIDGGDLAAFGAA